MPLALLKTGKYVTEAIVAISPDAVFKKCINSGYLGTLTQSGSSTWMQNEMTLPWSCFEKPYQVNFHFAPSIIKYFAVLSEQ